MLIIPFKDHMTENQYHKEYQEYLELALQIFLLEKEGLSENDARIQVMQDFENVEKRARLAGYLWTQISEETNQQE